MVVRLCLGGRSRSRDLAASADLRRQLNNQLRPHNNKLRPRNNSRQCTWRLGQLMVGQGAIWASMVEVRSRDLTASAELHMAPGTSLLTRRDKSSLSPSSASALMEGQGRQGEEMSWRTVRDDRASVVDPRSRDLADSADPKQQTKTVKTITLLKNYVIITSHYINDQ